MMTHPHLPQQHHHHHPQQQQQQQQQQPQQPQPQQQQPPSQQYGTFSAGPSNPHLHAAAAVAAVGNGSAGIAPQDTTHQPGNVSAGGPLVATGDWTKDLVQLAKTAELKKHALTLQLHTAHILSAHASLEQKLKAIQDIKEQKNKLESERTRLLNCLRQINEDRDKVDMTEDSLNRECAELRLKINALTEGEYAVSKADVDRLREELGQPPMPSLQSTLDEKSSQYLNERRMNGVGGAGSNTGSKRTGVEAGTEGQPGKRPRGRPKGSKNRTKGNATGSGGI